MILRELIASFGVKVEGLAAVQAIAREMGVAKVELTRLVAAFGRLAAVTGGAAFIAHFVNQQAELADSIGDTSERLGISSQALQAWRLAAELNGSSAEEMDQALGLLQRSLANVGEGSREQSQALRRLGVNFRAADGTVRPMQELLPEIADGFQRVTDPTRRAAIATRLFGRQGARLVPLLARGREGVAGIAQEFQDLGGGASDEAIQMASDYRDNISRLSVAFTSLRQRIANFFLPTFLRVTEAMVGAARSFFAIVDRTHLVQAALVAFLGAMVAVGVPAAATLIAAFWPVIASALLVAAGIAVIVLVVDDLMTLFSGGRSLIGEFIDALFGVGSAAAVVDSARRGWDLWMESIEETWQMAREFFAWLGAPAQSDRTQRRGFRSDDAIGADANRERETIDGALSGRRHISGEEAIQFAQRHRARVATAQASGRPVGAVSVSSPVQITVPPGTDPAAAAHIARVVDERMQLRNRQAIATLTRQAVE